MPKILTCNQNMEYYNVIMSSRNLCCDNANNRLFDYIRHVYVCQRFTKATKQNLILSLVTVSLRSAFVWKVCFVISEHH